jgi:hypothetical protein
MQKLNSSQYEVKKMEICTTAHEVYAVFAQPAAESTDDYYYIERIMALLLVEDKKGDIFVLPYTFDMDDASLCDTFVTLTNKEDADDSNFQEILNDRAKKVLTKANIKFTDFSLEETQ